MLRRARELKVARLHFVSARSRRLVASKCDEDGSQRHRRVTRPSCHLSLATCHFIAFPHTLDFMGKSKIPETGAGYLGETMVHRISHAVGVVEGVIEAKAGWPPEITLKLPDGTFKKGKARRFPEPNRPGGKKISPA